MMRLSTRQLPSRATIKTDERLPSLEFRRHVHHSRLAVPQAPKVRVRLLHPFADLALQVLETLLRGNVNEDTLLLVADPGGLDPEVLLEQAPLLSTQFVIRVLVLDLLVGATRWMAPSMANEAGIATLVLGIAGGKSSSVDGVVLVHVVWQLRGGLRLQDLLLRVVFHRP